MLFAKRQPFLQKKTKIPTKTSYYTIFPKFQYDKFQLSLGQLPNNFEQKTQFYMRIFNLLLTYYLFSIKMQQAFVDLQRTLQTAQPGFAYKMLALQMSIENQNVQKDMKDISQLTALYMMGLQVLQSRSDNRFHYFYKKIQNLLFKNQIIEKLKEASGCKETNNNTLKQYIKLERRRQQYLTQVKNTQSKFDDEKTRQIIKNAELKLQKYNGTVRVNIEKQQNNLAQRITERKLRSLSKKGKQMKSFKKLPASHQAHQQQQSSPKQYNQYYGQLKKQSQQPENKLHSLKQSIRKNNFL